MILQTPTAQGQGGFLTMFAPLIIIFVIFYFLLIRPQQKNQKKLQAMLQAVRKGDKVITRGGIHGQVVAVQDTVATIEIAPNVQIKLNKDAIIHVSTQS